MAAEQIREVLRARHRLQAEQNDDFTIRTQVDIGKVQEGASETLTMMLFAIASVSLLVGGIGIMNIMLASVTERTREIGIRRALGARRRDVVIQFLTETVILSGTGGLIGVALGVLIPVAVSHFAGLKAIVTLWSPVLAFTISGLVGIVFGIYPAVRAAKMDPVEALRHE